MDTLEAILKRRSIRKYTDQKVEKEKLIKLMEAAMAAPTACNNQPWEFIIITDDKKMDAVRAGMDYGKYNAPAAIVICNNPEIGLKPFCQDFWEQDCTAALENILLAAVSMDLGTVWLGVHPKEHVIKNVREFAGIPDHIIPLAVVYVGYPAEEPEPRTQYEERRVHWEQY
ncbi:MAG: nitroreductase family protein [Anaerolineaceae bacterium]|nr:nitroreductase family protein [Anaerolineaceae bacterium]